MSSSYQLMQQAYALVDALIASDGDLTEEVSASMAQLGDAIPAKLGGIKHARARLRSEIALHRDEIANHQGAIKTLTNSISRVERLALGLLASHEELTGEAKASGSWGKAWTTTSQSVEVSTDGLEDRWLIAQPPKVDKRGIKEYLKAGNSLPYASLVSKTSITLK